MECVMELCARDKAWRRKGGFRRSRIKFLRSDLGAFAMSQLEQGQINCFAEENVQPAQLGINPDGIVLAALG